MGVATELMEACTTQTDSLISDIVLSSLKNEHEMFH